MPLPSGARTSCANACDSARYATPSATCFELGPSGTGAKHAMATLGKRERRLTHRATDAAHGLPTVRQGRRHRFIGGTGCRCALRERGDGPRYPSHGRAALAQWIIAGRPLAAASSSVDSGSKWLPWAAAKLVQSSPVAASRIASNRPRFSLQKGNAVHICTTRHRM